MTHTPAHRIAVLAHESTNPLLLTWLREADYEPHAWDGIRPVHQYTRLVTYFPTRAATTAAVLPTLPLLAPGAVWVHLGQMWLDQADKLAETARAAGVRYIHAPYLQLPATGTRPFCVAYTWADDEAAPIITALAPECVRWAGPLERRTAPTPGDLTAYVEFWALDDPEQEQQP